MTDINDDDLERYVNEAFTEQLIRNTEDHLLKIMKHRYQKYPTQKNDDEWLIFTNYVCRRRAQRSAEEYERHN